MVSLLVPVLGEGATRSLDCSTGTINAFLPRLRSGDTLLVSGTCNENVVIGAGRNNITLHGQGTATINGPDANSSTVIIRGNGVTILGFNITGGRSGVQLSGGASATISFNAIQGVGDHGVLVSQNSTAVIINNVIQNNVNGSGIVVTDSATARVGFSNAQDTVASPNTISGNGTASGNHGIALDGSSFAQIVGNTISGNGVGGVGDGINVVETSSAKISSNTIDNNSRMGIHLGRNSFVQLGRDSGTGIFETPNSTTVNNGVNGIRCFITSSADGRLGSLTGTSAAKSFSANCVDDLLP
jgi:parallel beta-helix repeat protein